MQKTIGIFLVALLLVVTLQSTIFFFAKLKVSFIEWLFFNCCAISNIVFLIGFIIFLLTRNRALLHTAILPMFFFGTLGILFFPWKGMNIIPQIGHITMTLNIAWTVYTTIMQKDFIASTVGLFIGILVFAPFIGLQQNYMREHPEDFKRIVGDIVIPK